MKNHLERRPQPQGSEAAPFRDEPLDCRVGATFGARRPGRRVAAIGVFLLAVAGCAGDAGDAGETGDVAITEGRSLYEANCMMCHGESALGDGPIARTLPVPPPALMAHLGHHTEAQLIQLIRDGVPPAMPPTPLAEADVRLIVDYLWTLVPESEVTALREMQLHMEMMGDSAAGSMGGMKGMEGMPAMDSSHAPAR